MDSDEDWYEVGFGKPPKKRRFARGQSGNPKGRPKGSKNVSSILGKVERQRVKVNGERSRTISKVEAAYTQLVNQAASGNLTAIRELLRCHRMHPEGSESSVPQVLLHERDEAVMKSIIKRIRESDDPDSATAVDANQPTVVKEE